MNSVSLSRNIVDVVVEMAYMSSLLCAFDQHFSVKFEQPSVITDIR